MAPNQQEQHQQQQEMKAEIPQVPNANWELDRLSTTGRSFILEPESRTGIVQELQQRLQQEQKRRHELLLRSANNALQSPPPCSQQQMPKDSDGTVSAIDQTTQRIFLPSASTVDDETIATPIFEQNNLMSESPVAVVSAAELAETSRKTVPDKTADTSAQQTSSEFNKVENQTQPTAGVRAEWARSFAPIMQNNSVTSMEDLTATKGAETAAVTNETALANEEAVPASQLEARTLTLEVLNAATESAKNQRASINEESATAVRRAVPQAGKRNSDRSATGRVGTANEASMDSTKATGEKKLPNKYTQDPSSAASEASTSRRNASLPSSVMVSDQIAANQYTGSTSFRPTYPITTDARWRADYRTRNEPTPTAQHSAAGSLPPSPPNAPSPPTPPTQPVPPCLQCLMRCLRDSDLLGSCWKAAMFELEEAFTIKKVADAAVGKIGAGAGGEWIQPMPIRSVRDGVVVSGGEGSSGPSSSSPCEFSKWQALERLCNLRNSLKTCSHVTENE